MTDNAQLYISHGDGWTHIGHSDGPIKWVRPTAVTEELRTVRFPLSMSISVDFTGASAEFYRLVHDFDLAYQPRKHGHCPTCHPEQDSRPLAIDGREYRSRQRARQRRRRHGH